MSSQGTTSACAENTGSAAHPEDLGRNYLRVRGEYPFGGCPSFYQQNYLRVRGEYGVVIKMSFAFSELPPRARRIRGTRECARVCGGTTSACAENTPRFVRFDYQSRNYLRVRGEYDEGPFRKGSTSELPPRARRIPMASGWLRFFWGTTSACAENTRSIGIVCQFLGNYLRVRGEYARCPSVANMKVELPPRARRIPPLARCRNRRSGTTSACAENTQANDCSVSKLRNYLRVRGEYHLRSDQPEFLLELPPRARRIQASS